MSGDIDEPEESSPEETEEKARPPRAHIPHLKEEDGVDLLDPKAGGPDPSKVSRLVLRRRTMLPVGVGIAFGGTWIAVLGLTYANPTWAAAPVALLLALSLGIGGALVILAIRGWRLTNDYMEDITAALRPAGRFVSLRASVMGSGVWGTLSGVEEPQTLWVTFHPGSSLGDDELLRVSYPTLPDGLVLEDLEAVVAEKIPVSDRLAGRVVEEPVTFDEGDDEALVLLQRKGSPATATGLGNLTLRPEEGHLELEVGGIREIGRPMVTGLLLLGNAVWASLRRYIEHPSSRRMRPESPG